MELELGQLDRKYASLRIEERGRRSRLAASLAQHGQQTPVLVVPTDSTDRWVLVDGYLRVSALEDLCRDVVNAVAVAMDEAEALVMGHRLDNARRRSALEDGWLLQELSSVHGRDLGSLSVLLGRSRSWVSRRLSLVHVLPRSVQQAVRGGRLSPHVAMKYLVPLARANGAQCETLVERLGSATPTVRQMERLYMAWRTSDADGRQRIVEHPHLYLKAEDEAAGGSGDEELDRQAAQLRRDVETIAAVCWRASRRLDGGVLDVVDGTRRRRLRRAFDEARHGFSSLSARMDQGAQRDARSRDTYGDPAIAS